MTPVSALALEVICHGSKKETLAPFVAPLNAAMERFDIVTPERQAAFLAQVAHESLGFSVLQENLNYSHADRIAAIFRSRFDKNNDKVISPDELAFAQEFVHQPTKLANFVYANREGNGDVASGDGYRYRGRGPIQITFKNLYRACSIALFNDASVLINDPDQLLKPEYGALSAAWCFWSKGLNELADEGDFREITRRIAGAYTNYVQRCELWTTCKQVLV